MNERVKHLRKDLLNMSMEAFGGKIGLTKAAISSFEAGRNGMSDMAIKAICREFNVNEEWLRNGVGEVFNALDPEEDLQELAAKIMTDTPESFRRRFISVLARLNDGQWRVLAEISDMLAEGCQEDLADPAKDAEAEYIKKISKIVQKADATASSSTEEDA